MSIYVYYFFSLLGLTFFYSNSNKISKITNLYKKSNDKTPLIGGLGIYIFFIAGIINFYFHNSELILNNINLVIIISLVFLIGIFDDIYNLSYATRLISIFTLIIIFLNFENKFIINQLYFETFNRTYNLGNISYFITALFIVLFINSMNMADGINGNSSLIFLTFFYILFEPYSFLNIFLVLITMSLMIFLFFNLKNKLYLGDSGVYFISIFFALYVIYKYNYGVNTISSEKIFVTFMIPGIDMLRLFCVRLYNRSNPFKGDLNHLHHLLINKFNIYKSLLVYVAMILWPYLIYNVFEIKIYYLIILNMLVYSGLIIILKKHNTYLNF